MLIHEIVFMKTGKQQSEWIEFVQIAYKCTYYNQNIAIIRN